MLASWWHFHNLSIIQTQYHPSIHVIVATSFKAVLFVCACRTKRCCDEQMYAIPAGLTIDLGNFLDLLFYRRIYASRCRNNVRQHHQSFVGRHTLVFNSVSLMSTDNRREPDTTSKWRKSTRCPSKLPCLADVAADRVSAARCHRCDASTPSL